MSEKQKQGEIRVNITSSYGARTRKPLVNLAIGDNLFMFESAKAKEIGLSLVEVALAAEADAFLFEFVSEGKSPTQDESRGTSILFQYRKWRQQQKAKEKKP